MKRLDSNRGFRRKRMQDLKALFRLDGNRFDPDFYGAYYDDLRGFSRKELRNHYRNHGRGEKRFGNFLEALETLERRHGPLPEDFSATEYLRLNPELPPEEWRLKLHYLQFGRNEGRQYRHRVNPVSIEELFGSFAKVTRIANIKQTNGVSEFTSDDPQIFFHFLPEVAKSFFIMDFSIQITSCDSKPADPRIYFDYGDGFSEQNSVSLAEVKKDVWLAHIPLPALALGFRLDPASERGCARLLDASVSLTPIQKALATWFQSGDTVLYKEVQRIVEQVGSRLHSEQVAQGKIAAGHTPETERRAYAMAAASAFHALNRNLNAREIQYRRWIEHYDTITDKDFADMKEQAEYFPVKPLFSIIMPTYNSNIEFLEAAINSILEQTYSHFEICIADDCSTKKEVREFIAQMAAKHACIRYVFREKNGHISECSNSALELARGDYLVLVDHDDVIAPHALWMVAYYINMHPDAQILYSDEDKLEVDGRRCDPYFKGDFDNYLMYGHNLVSHLGVYAASLVKKVGGFRKGYEGSQDYDLLLRCADECEPRNIVHIPHVLYHWRKVAGSTAISADQKDYAIIAARKAINDHFARRNRPYLSVEGKFPGNSSVQITPEVWNRPRKVAVIIPTRDRLEDLDACLKSIDRASSQPHEIVVVDNDSQESETLRFLKTYEARSGRTRVVRHPGEFNFSAINNRAAASVESEIICFLNNDTEILAEDWLKRATAHFEVPDVGAVGAKLLFPNRTIQHFGVYLGQGPHRTAVHPHLGLSSDAPGYCSKASLIQQFSAATAACLFVRRDVFKAIGGFDENLKVAYNDVDLCIRIRKAGYRILVDPDVLLLHKESVTRGHDLSPEKAARLDREAAMMREKWASVLDSDPFYSPNLSPNADFMPAFPPRITYPWKLPTKWRKQEQRPRWKNLTSFFTKSEKQGSV